MTGTGRLIIALAALIVLGVGTTMLLNWGTIAPCAALAADLKQTLTARAAASVARDPAAAAGEGLGLFLAAPMVDAAMAGLTPLECARGLYRRHFLGERLY